MPPTDTIRMLSDQELASRLRDYGVNVGPIVQSTRTLYEKKLLKIEYGREVSKPKYEEVPDDDEDEEEESDEEQFDEEEEVRQIPVRSTRYEPRQRVPVKVTPSRATRQQELPQMVEEMSSRTQRQTRSAPQTNKKPESKGGFPIWILFLIIILGGLGYLIMKNMEPAAENRIPNQVETHV